MPAWLDHLIREGTLVTPSLIDAFRAVKREDFVLPGYREEAEVDTALPIGHGQTISQPYTVALMLELLEPGPGMRILDVGSGSGWTTALLGHIVGKSGHVWGLERVPELVSMGQSNLAPCHFPQAEIGQAGTALGLPDEAPFDRILVSAGARRLPQAFVSQLKVGGILVIPIAGALWQVRKTGNAETEIRKIEGFAFVPLIEE